MKKEQALERLNQIEIETAELRKIINQPENQMAEEYLKDILSKCTGRICKDKIIWSIDGQWIFEQELKNKRLWCYYYKVWQVFEKEYALSVQQIQELHKKVVCEALNCMDYTPTYHLFVK